MPDLEDRIAELEERVAWLEGELGIAERSTRAAALRRKGVYLGAAKMLLALYDAKGKVVSQWRLFEDIDHVHPDPGVETVRVYISRLRGKFGPDVIETVRSLGYRITPVGTQMVESLLPKAA